MQTATLKLPTPEASAQAQVALRALTKIKAMKAAPDALTQEAQKLGLGY